MTEHLSNGRGPTWRIIAATFGLLLLTVVSFLLGNIFNRLSESQLEIHAQQRQLTEQAIDQAVQNYRVSAVEANIEKIQVDIKAIRDRIEQ